MGSAAGRRLPDAIHTFLASPPLDQKGNAMRLRRATAIAAAAAAAAVTLTAAVSPAAPADPPVSLPALTQPALTARYAANDQAAAVAARAATRSGNQALAHTLAGLSHQQLLGFDSQGQGEAVEVIGNLATARRVAILVPGSDTSLATFDSRGTASPEGGARALAAQARRLDPGAHLAIIAWLGYRTPSLLSPAVLSSGNAGQGAAALRPLVKSLAARGDQVALLCHSYGSVVCGLAAPHLPVTDIAVFGSPGMDASSVRSLHTTARVWAGREAGDWIRYVPHIHLLGLGFGTDPTAPSFGARRFACGSHGHSSYLSPGSSSLRNLTYIALGRPTKVTR
jgi:Alpha/beta hydrolase